MFRDNEKKGQPTPTVRSKRTKTHHRQLDILIHHRMSQVVQYSTPREEDIFVCREPWLLTTVDLQHSDTTIDPKRNLQWRRKN